MVESSGSEISLLVLVAIVAVGVLVGLILLRVTLARNGGAEDGSREAPMPGTGPMSGPMSAPAARAHDVIFFLRFEGRDDETYVRDLVARHARIGSAMQAREAALDVVRAAPTATHAYCGPSTAAPQGPRVARTGLPGGIVLGFLVRGTQPLDTVADDSSLQAVVAELRKVAAWIDTDFAGAELQLAQVALDAPTPALVAVRKETRPGHQLCAYCGEAFLAHDTRCPNCGARVGA